MEEMILADRFRQNVAAVLAAKGWSQSELARRMTVSPQTVSQYIKGDKSPGLDMVAKFAAALECDDPADLLGADVAAHA